MSSESSFEARFAAGWPPQAWKDVTVVLAVSGGADSIAMLRAAAAVRLPGAGRIIVAHFHHGLRGADADADEHFVAETAAELGLDCRIGRATTPQAVGGPQSAAEDTARRARYAFLSETSRQVGARMMATAHTADDQAETVLHRIVRGAGLRGLGGIPRSRPLGEIATLVRPLLEFRRREVLAYLDGIGQRYREDATNRDVALTRNRIRHELLPQLEAQYNQQAVEAVLRLSALAREAQAEIDAVADALVERCAKQRGVGDIVINCPALADASEYLRREVLISIWRRQQWPEQSMGHAEWSTLAAMAESSAREDKAREFPGRIRAVRSGDTLTLAGPVSSMG